MDTRQQQRTDWQCPGQNGCSTDRERGIPRAPDNPAWTTSGPLAGWDDKRQTGDYAQCV